MFFGEYQCYVGNLASATNDQNLQMAFCQFGEIIDYEIIYDRVTGKSREFGYVTFKEEQSMTDAIKEMNGKDLDGRIITVIEAHSRGSIGGGSRGVYERWSGGYGDNSREEGSCGGSNCGGRAGGSICGG